MTDEELIAIVTDDPIRRSAIERVAALNLPDSWIAGGFVRNAVWDALFGNGNRTPINDVDVVYFRPLDSYGADPEALLEQIRKNESNPVWEEESAAVEVLAASLPDLSFEVKNQARMHISSVRTITHEPYHTMSEAVAMWVETATAIGIRMNEDGTFSVLAPYGLDDLAHGIIRPTRPSYAEYAKERAARKCWVTLWPTLQFKDA